MKLTYHGHSVLAIQLADGQKLLFDPFITGNALTDLDADTVETDWLLITHGHSDHIGDMKFAAMQPAKALLRRMA